MKNVFLIAVVALLMVVGMVMVRGQVVMAMGGGEVVSITSDELADQLKKGADAPFLLDVREPQEYEMGHIEGATLIPLGSLEDRLAELPKDKKIVIYCRSGNRSRRAANLLLENGFTQVENLTGGMTAWSSQCAAKKAC